jgi:hypothetical protein
MTFGVGTFGNSGACAQYANGEGPMPLIAGASMTLIPNMTSEPEVTGVGEPSLSPSKRMSAPRSEASSSSRPSGLRDESKGSSANRLTCSLSPS